MSDVLVLCYHAVSRGWRSDLAVTPEALEAEVAREAAQMPVALEARRAGYVPKLFGYTDTSVDPRGLSPSRAAG